MDKNKPYVALTPQEEVTAPMPLPPPPHAKPIVLSSAVSRLLANDETARVTPPGTNVPVNVPAIRATDETARITPPGTTIPKAKEPIEGVKSGEVTARPRRGQLFRMSTPARAFEVFSLKAGPLTQQLKIDPDRIPDEDSVVIEPIADDNYSRGADLVEGSGDIENAVVAVEDDGKTTAIKTLDIEHRSTILYWLVNLAREQGLVRGRARNAEERDIIRLDRIMERDPALHDYKFNFDDEEVKIDCKQAPMGKPRRLHSIEMTIYDWSKFEKWVEYQSSNNFRDLVMIEALDPEIRIAAWEYLHQFAELVREKSEHGRANQHSGQPAILLGL